MIKRIRKYIRYWLQRLFILLRRITLPGFQKVGLYDVLRFFSIGLFDAKFTLMAAAMAYNFFFSAVPAIFLIYTSLTYIPAENFDMQAETRDYIEQFVPHNVYMLIEQIATSDYADQRRSGTIILGIFLTLYGATRGVIAMMKAFTKDAEGEELFKRRNVFQLYGIAFVLFVVLSTLLFLSIGFLIFGKTAIGYLQSADIITSGIQASLLSGLTSLITLILLFLSVSIIYYMAPATKQRWKFFTPGGIVAGLLTFFIVIGYGYFITEVANFSQVYGSLGAIILLMLLFYYISMVLLIGFELNAAIDLASYHQKEKQLSRPQSKEHHRQEVLDEWWS